VRERPSYRTSTHESRLGVTTRGLVVLWESSSYGTVGVGSNTWPAGSLDVKQQWVLGFRNASSWFLPKFPSG